MVDSYIDLVKFI